MQKFKVVASYVTYVTTEIEASSENEAYQIAKHMESGEFNFQAIDDWDITSVSEVTE